MRRRALALATVVALGALAVAWPARQASGFMRPRARAAGARVDGTYVATLLGRSYEVRLETRNEIVSGAIVAPGVASGFVACGLVRDGRLLLAVGETDGGGFAVYRFADDGARGEYSHFATHDYLGEELITGGPLGGPPGVYDWIARAPGPTPLPLGTGGKGRLTIRGTGTLLHFDWMNGLTGVGLRNGAVVIVGWGGSGTHEAVSLAPSADGWRGVIADDDTVEPIAVSLVRMP